MKYKELKDYIGFLDNLESETVEIKRDLLKIIANEALAYRRLVAAKARGRLNASLKSK